MVQSYLNGKPLSDLHPSLNNKSKINYYIEKTRRSQYPFGQNILGVAHEFMKHEKSTDPYIRSIRKLLFNLFYKLMNNLYLIYFIRISGWWPIYRCLCY